MVWDKLKPAGSQKLRLADDDLRANNEALEDALDLDHDFTTGGTQTGEHHKVTLQKQESDPGEEVDKGKLYTKEIDEEIELFYRDHNAEHILQLTRKGEIDLIPAGTKMLFYQDTAPAGWTIEDTLDEKLVFITKGKGIGGTGAGGSPGGEPHLGSFVFDGGSNAEDLQENDTIQYLGGGSWSCRLRSIEYSGAAPNQTGRIYYDTLAGGTPADDDPIEDDNSRNFEADMNGLNRAAGSWTISGFTGHTHVGGSHSHKLYEGNAADQNDQLWNSGGELIVIPAGAQKSIPACYHISRSESQSDVPITDAWTEKVAAGETESETVTQNANWRPSSYSCIICAKD